MNLSEIFFSILSEELIFAVLSSPLDKDFEYSKISFRPISKNGNVYYQASYQVGKKEIHKNLSPKDCEDLINNSLTHHFKQGLFCTTSKDYQVLVNKKKQFKVLTSPPSKKKQSMLHNRKKNHILEEGLAVDFLVELGILNQSGKIADKKGDKFKQVNRFLELVQDLLPHLQSNKTLKIIDFGCGKAYLTFALYHFLHIKHHLNIEMYGLDLKKEVIEFCQNLADKLGYKNLHFAIGDIKNFNQEGEVDMVVALHACDTATDMAIEKALQWKANIILCVPCCQHELYPQVKSNELTPLLKHGILKERFASLATDAARAQLLEIFGYNTQIIEFIDMEHTPKNLLIRATRRNGSSVEQAKLLEEEYIKFKNFLNISPFLERCLRK